MAHWSDCPVNNAPALPVGACTCGNNAPNLNPVGHVSPYQPIDLRYPGRKPVTPAQETV